MSKTSYYFKPHLHWNTINKDAYEYLQKFYSDEYLKMEVKDE